ncbi:MAG: ScnB-like protein [Pseudomonadota bacterium]
MTTPSGPHDIGGVDAGPIDPSEHDTAWWEWQVDAMVRLAMGKGLFTDFAELRDGIERLAPEDYERLTYYERWATSLAHTLLDKGVVTQEQLDARVAEIRKRQAAAGEPE